MQCSTNQHVHAEKTESLRRLQVPCNTIKPACLTLPGDSPMFNHNWCGVCKPKSAEALQGLTAFMSVLSLLSDF